ncbi:MAG: alpha/beta hydrolase [Sandaracinus sp.]
MLLLPGLDGTATLWGPLLDALGEDARGVELARYDPAQSRYDALLEALAPRSEPALVVAESFGGPLAIRLAARDQRVRALVLVASFAVGPPLASLAPLIALAPRPPSLALRLAMLGLAAPRERVRELAAAVRAVPRAVVAARVAEVARVDVRAELRALRIPITWIVATHDRLVPPPRDVPGDVVPIEGPHLLAQTRPHEVAAIARRAARALR